MIELNGKYNTAKVFIDNLDNSTVSQIIGICNVESFKDSSIRIMPDCHSGKGCVVGTTMTIHDKVIPSLVGCDIGCGMLVIPLVEKRINLPKLDSVVNNVAQGTGKETKATKEIVKLIEQLKCIKNIPVSKEAMKLGSLGGGNHFIEVDVDEEGNNYLVIHTGSRHLGIMVESYYTNMAVRLLEETECRRIVDEVKSTVPRDQIDKVLKEKINYYKAWIKANLTKVKATAFCEGQLFDDYIHDMKITQEYASRNRAELARIILKEAKLTENVEGNSVGITRFDTIHNYIDTEHMILRKGSVSARLGERLIIPINMRDGSLICIGKGNDGWNQSAPHGAGRLFSRAEAKQNFTVSEYKKTMEENGIYTSSVGKSTLDECPMAYKPMDDIVDNIKDTVEIEYIIKPIYNFKSGEEELLELRLADRKEGKRK